MLDKNRIEEVNQRLQSAHKSDLDHLATKLSRTGVDIEAVISQAASFDVAIPSWALGTGGTRFGRFPGGGEPRDIFEKMQDIALLHQLTGACSKVSLHIPWDEPKDPKALRNHASSLNLGFDAVNSNTFQDQPGQKHSYKFGSLSHTSADVRAQAVEHNKHVIDVGKTLESDSITVWLSDGSNFPGQMHLRKSYERVLDSLKDIYAHMPDAWRMFIEYKPYEPAFYATVIQDWGSSFLLASRLGEKAYSLVDLGHHLPNTNIELVVARLIGAGKLGGFHFNDSKYGDDDLTSGSIKPYQLFLVFNELVDAAVDNAFSTPPAYMIDQSHNIKDPIEALLQTVGELQRAYTKALLVDRIALSGYQESNDVLMAEQSLKTAYETDVSSIVAEARLRKGGAIDPIATFRSSRYRQQLAAERQSGTYVPPQSI
jgi:L-rhamnose isomerase / sugar isomerase